MNAHTKGINFATTLVNENPAITRDDFDTAVLNQVMALYKRESTRQQFIQGAEYHVDGRFFCNDAQIARHVNHLVNAINAHKREENFAKACGRTLETHRNNILHAQYEKAYTSLLSYNFPAHIFHSDKDGYLILSPVNFVTETKEEETVTPVETEDLVVTTPHKVEDVEQYYVTYTLDGKEYTFPCHGGETLNGCFDYNHFTFDHEIAVNDIYDSLPLVSMRVNRRIITKGTRQDVTLGSGRCVCGQVVVLDNEYNICFCGREYDLVGKLVSQRNKDGLTDEQSFEIAKAQYERHNVYGLRAESALAHVKQAIEAYFVEYPEERETLQGKAPFRLQSYLALAEFDLKCAYEVLENIVVDMHECSVKEDLTMATDVTISDNTPLNEGVTNIFDIDYGYLDQDGNAYHYDCRPNHVGGTPVTYSQVGNAIVTSICGECDMPLVESEEVDELWATLDTYSPSEDINDPIALYAEKPDSTVGSIEGFRAGYYGYPSQRNMTPNAYAEWTGFEYGYTWQVGYEAGIAQLDQDNQ